MTSVAVARQEQDNSGDYSDASQDIENSQSGNDGGHQESDYDSEGTESEHSDQDPDAKDQEQQRRVDDDEDRSNPQYIPKRGTFYEHDDRTAASGEETNNTTSEVSLEKKEGSETPSERRRPPRKSEIIDKWSHDKFNAIEQIPKSRDELVAIYGYDIRNEDAPPHARRNRKYGRGPNKYTRTWEDEEAYRRQTALQAAPRKPPTAEDFPELDATTKKPSRKPRAPRPRSRSQPTSNESTENGSQLRRNASTKTPKSKPTVRPSVNRSVANKSPPKLDKKMPPIENLTITTTVTNNVGPPQRKVNAVGQQRPVPTDHGRKKPVAPASPHHQQQSPQLNNTATNKTQQQSQPQSQSQQPTQQNIAPLEQRGGIKRYSSLRQRPLAETYSPNQQQQQQQQPQPQQQQQQQSQKPQQPLQSQQPQPQPQSQPKPIINNQPQQHRYHAEFNAGAQQANQHQGSPVPQIHQQQIIHQVHRNTPVNQAPHGPSPPHQGLPQPHTQQVRLGIMEQQQLVSHPHHTIHNLPPQHSIGQLQAAPQGYAPPAMMPAQYMQPPMYAQPPPAPYPHQLYQHHNYATQAGGVTYYSPVEQEQQPRAQRRPTAAIPIVRPATANSLPNSSLPSLDRPANSKENDNIDRIVENMFVRKPWPATPSADSKEKSQADRVSSQDPNSKESSQANSLTSSSISTDSKPSEPQESEAKSERKEEKESVKESTEAPPSGETIANDA